MKQLVNAKQNYKITDLAKTKLAFKYPVTKLN